MSIPTMAPQNHALPFAILPACDKACRFQPWPHRTMPYHSPSFQPATKHVDSNHGPTEPCLTIRHPSSLRQSMSIPTMAPQNHALPFAILPACDKACRFQIWSNRAYSASLETVWHVAGMFGESRSLPGREKTSPSHPRLGRKFSSALPQTSAFFLIPKPSPLTSQCYLQTSPASYSRALSESRTHAEEPRGGATCVPSSYRFEMKSVLPAEENF
jgi:hypothetical protein